MIDENTLRMRRALVPCTMVFFLSLTILAAVTVAWGPSKKFLPGNDADQYMAIGHSLADGNGFKNPVGPWPSSADYSRMPAWPAIISIGLRLSPGANPEAVTRFANAICLSFAGAFFCVLCGILGANSKLAVAGGLGVSLSPSLVYLSVDGMSEICFVMILGLGAAAFMAGRRWLFPAALILGSAALVRTNFILAPMVFIFLALLLRSARMELLRRENLGRAMVACFLVATPALLWAVRNAEITGRFPFLSSIEGETFYGANNEVVANNLEYWGYWVMPDTIPGETPKLKLARQLGSDLALNDYYHRKGAAWLKSNAGAIPRLELGKFVRAFVPIPWKPLPASYVAFSCRLLTWVLWIVLWPFWRPKINKVYLLFCLSMAIAQIITTAFYYGVFRFTHCFIEVLLIPCIALGLQQWWTGRQYIAGSSAEPNNVLV